MIEHNNEFYQNLAYKWAPINYQHIRLTSVNNYYQTKKDLLVPITLNFYKQKKGQFGIMLGYKKHPREATKD